MSNDIYKKYFHHLTDIHANFSRLDRNQFNQIMKDIGDATWVGDIIWSKVEISKDSEGLIISIHQQEPASIDQCE